MFCLAKGSGRTVSWSSRLAGTVHISWGFIAYFKTVSTTADSLWVASAESNVILLGQGIINMFSPCQLSLRWLTHASSSVKQMFLKNNNRKQTSSLCCFFLMVGLAEGQAKPHSFAGCHAWGCNLAQKDRLKLHRSRIYLKVWVWVLLLIISSIWGG